MKVLLLRLIVGILLLCRNINISFGWIVALTPQPRLTPPGAPQHHHSPTWKNSIQMLSFDARRISNSQYYYQDLNNKLQQHTMYRPTSLCSTSSSDSSNDDTESSANNEETAGIDLSFDPRLYKVRLSRATGIE